MADSELTISVEVISDAVKKLDSIDKSIDKVSSTIEKLNKNSLASSVAIGNIVSTAAIKGFELIADAAASFYKTMVVDGVRAASKDADAMNALSVALAQTGQGVAGAAQGFGEFAEQLQKTTKYGSDQIVNAGALLSQLTGLDQAGLKVATKSAADLASALGIDLESATQLVAKSIEGNTGALARHGIKVAQGADQAANFANTMSALARFSGAAEAQLNTFGGALSFTHNSFEEIQKVFGNVIVTNPAVVAVIQQLGKEFNALASGIAPDSKTMKVALNEALIFTIDLAAGAISAIDGMIRGFSVLWNAFDTAGNQVGAWIAKLQGNTEEYNRLSLAATNASNSMQGAFSDQTKLSSLVDSLSRIREAAVDGQVQIALGNDTVAASYKNAEEKLKQFTEAQKQQIELGKQLASQAVQGDGIQTELDAQTARHEAMQISDQEYYDAKNIAADAQFKKEQDALDLAYSNKQISSQAYNAAITESEKRHETARTKNEAEFNKQRAENMKSTLSTISSLQSSSSKELFRVGQAAAISVATIDGIAAVQKALAAAPPPFNFALAGLVGVATAANIAKIASAQPPGLVNGIDSVPGTGFADSYPAILAPGERVVPRSTNEDLRSFLADSSGMRGVMETISAKLDRLANTTVVQIGERVIAHEVRSAIESGRVVMA